MADRAERADDVAAMRERQRRDRSHAEDERQRLRERFHARGRQQVLSPMRVRQLKAEDAQRKHSHSTLIRERRRAFEAKHLERQAEETAYRQQMHDKVLLAKYQLA